MASPAETLTANPLLGDFNTGTTAGQKNFERKTAGVPEDQRIDLNRKNAAAF